MSCKRLVYMQIPIQSGIWMRVVNEVGQRFGQSGWKGAVSGDPPPSAMGMGGGRLGKVRECLNLQSALQKLHLSLGWDFDNFAIRIFRHSLDPGLFSWLKPSECRIVLGVYLQWFSRILNHRCGWNLASKKSLIPSSGLFPCRVGVIVGINYLDSVLVWLFEKASGGWGGGLEHWEMKYPSSHQASVLSMCQSSGKNVSVGPAVLCVGQENIAYRIYIVF